MKDYFETIMKDLWDCKRNESDCQWARSTISMRGLAYKAFGEGKLPFSLVRKLKKSDEIIFYQLIQPMKYECLRSRIRMEDDE